MLQFSFFVEIKQKHEFFYVLTLFGKENFVKLYEVLLSYKSLMIAGRIYLYVSINFKIIEQNILNILKVFHPVI